MSILDKVRNTPPWAIELAFGLIDSVGKLFGAKSEVEREEAAMEAAERVKASLDRKKFGG